VVKCIKKPRAAGDLVDRVDRRELQNKTQKIGLKFADLKSNGN